MPNAPPDDVELRVRAELDLPRILAYQLRKQLGTTLEPEELEAVGLEALTTAARGFDPSRGVPFRRWANLRIRGAMIDAVRSHGPLPRSMYQRLRALEAADHVSDGRSEEDAASPPTGPAEADRRLTEFLSGMAMAAAAGWLCASEELAGGGPQPGDPEEQLGRHQLIALLRTTIAKRPDAERTLLTRHYFDDVTLEQAGKELGLSKSWASRLHARAIEAVAKEVRESEGIG